MIYLCLGRRELGKTTLARYLAAQRTPSLILDTRSQWPTRDPWRTVPHDEMLTALEMGETIVVQPYDEQDSSDRAARVVREYLDAPVTRELSVVIDEAALIDDLKAWSYVFRGSPRMRTTIVLTTHRPQDLPTHLRAVADVWCLFRTTQEHDLKVIEARCGADVARLVQDLKPYHFVSWNDAKGVLREHHTPETWFTPGPMPFEDTGKPFSSKATGLF